MKKILLTATVQSHIAQFHRPLIRLLHEQGYEIHAAARNDLHLKNGLALPETVTRCFDIPFERPPLHWHNLQAYSMLKRLIDREQYTMISCHTPVGGIVTRLAAQRARKNGTKVYYTAHGFHFYHGAPRKNWILYYTLEKQMAPLTDCLITINTEDQALAASRFRTTVRRIHGVGADTEKYFFLPPAEAAQSKTAMGYGDRTVILCVGELNANKNQSTVLRAMRQVVHRHPDALLLLAGNGPYEQRLQKEIAALQLQPYARLIGYHADLERYTRLCDIVVSASYREGLPLAVVEAMLCGKPVVASHNRGHDELIEDGVGGFLTPPKDTAAFAEKLDMLLSDAALRAQMGEHNRQTCRLFTDKAVERELADIYFT